MAVCPLILIFCTHFPKNALFLLIILASQTFYLRNFFIQYKYRGFQLFTNFSGILKRGVISVTFCNSGRDTSKYLVSIYDFVYDVLLSCPTHLIWPWHFLAVHICLQRVLHRASPDHLFENVTRKQPKITLWPKKSEGFLVSITLVL